MVSPGTFDRDGVLSNGAELAPIPRSGITASLCVDGHLFNFGRYDYRATGAKMGSNTSPPLAHH